MTNETTPAPVRTYKSSSGREIPISAMPDTHLVNAVRKIEKNAAPGAPLPEVYPELVAELEKRSAETRAWYAERRASGK